MTNPDELKKEKGAEDYTFLLFNLQNLDVDDFKSAENHQEYYSRALILFGFTDSETDISEMTGAWADQVQVVSWNSVADIVKALPDATSQ